MKVITVYELLGKVKDNEAPKKIRYRNGYLYKDFLFDGEASNYISGKDWLFGEDITAMLNDEVEIIEENKKIEHEKKYFDFAISSDDVKFSYLYKMGTRIMDKINSMEVK